MDNYEYEDCSFIELCQEDSDFTVIHEDIGMPNEHLHVQLKQRG